MEAKILTGILSSDTNTRLQAGDQLLEYIRDEANNIAEFEELDSLVGGLAAWMGSNNFRVSLSAMDILIMIIIQMKDKFKPFLGAVTPMIKDKLGDSKDQVREKTQMLLQQIMQDAVSSPQKFLETIMEGLLVHKNFRVKEQALICIGRTLSFFGSGQISVSKFVGKICELLSDANAQVRVAAVNCLAEIYERVGVKVRMDISKRGLPDAKLQMVFRRFDEVDKEGNGAVDGNGMNGDDDESLLSCSSSTSLSSGKVQNSVNQSASKKRKPLSANASGAVGEDTFIKAFTDVPQLNVYNQHDVDTTLASIQKTLSNKNTEWDVRIDSIKELRALIQLEILDIPSFLVSLRSLEIPLNESLKDLRSQVVRETCVTLSCLAVHLKGDMSPFAELFMPNLIALLPNSAKVMASSGTVCITMMIKNCPSARLVNPIAASVKSSKSAVVRKSCAEFISLMTNSWDTSILDRAGSVFEETLVKGLKDSDPTARKFMRRAFWGYHSHYPTVADKLFDSLDSNVQKHLKDEKNGSSTTSGGSTQLSQVKSKIKRASLMSIAQQSTNGQEIEISLPPRPPSSNAVLPSTKVRPPSGKPPRRTTEPALSMSSKKLSRSSENLLSDGLGAPQRIQKTQKPPDVVSQRPNTPTRQRLAGGRESPVRSKNTSLSRKAVSGLSQEAVKQFGGTGYDDEDETGSITSERSSFSLSSEVSVMPYATAKFPNPITDLDELSRLCTSKSWSDRRDGIAQLHLLLESSNELSHLDLMKIRDIFKRMFAEPHTKVYGMFLETLYRFIEEHRVYLDDWIFLLLLKLLHKQGTDVLKSIQSKIQIALEHIRHQFDVDAQFTALCRILTDQSQPMNNKVKQAWLEYVHELIPLMNSEDFKDNTETRLAFSKLLTLTMEPKSVDIRKGSHKVITDLFNLNTAGFSLMLRGVPRNLQENADKIIKGYLMEGSSSDEDNHEPSSPIFSAKTNATPTNKTPPTNVQRSVGLTQKGRQISSSSPDVSSIGYESPRTPRSRLPIPSGHVNSPTGRMTPSKIPRPNSRQGGGGGGGYPPRAQSVDPERMMTTHSLMVSNTAVTRERYQRPMSSQSEHVSMQRSIRGIPTNSLDIRPPSSQGFMLDHFISHLPVLDFGSSGTEQEGETQDQVGSVLKELKNSTSSKLRSASLQSLFSLARNYDNSNWRDHVEEAINLLLSCVEKDEPAMKSMALRVLRELIKARPPGVTMFTEKLTNCVLESYNETECNVSHVSEDLFSPLAAALPPQRMFNVLSPVITVGTDNFNLGGLKLLSKVVSHTEPLLMEQKLSVLVPSIVKGYCHEESYIRKASVFCLVEIHAVVGEKLRPYLTALSSSQTKLLDLYIKKHHPTTAAKQSTARPTSSGTSKSDQ